MKVQVFKYTYGGLGIEVIAETPAETVLLRQAWEHGEMSIGKGQSADYQGYVTGFFVHLKKSLTDKASA